MKATEQMQSILYALASPDPTTAPTLMITLRILAEGVCAAHLENGLPLRDATDFRLYLLECADAVREATKKESVPA